MKKYLGLVKYLAPYKTNIVLYFVFILLSVVFGILSIGALLPFIEVLFQQNVKQLPVPPPLEFSAESALAHLRFQLSELIRTRGGMFALSLVCVFIIVSVFLKNMFVYGSYYVMSPMRNGMMVRLRNDLYSKILTLPIGFFTESRKGDLMSRMTTDTWELEGAVANTLDGLIKEPVTVIVLLGTLVWLSPQLSLMLLVLLPLAGLIIGRVSKSLKKESHAAAIKSGEGLSILEETLGGMRVIKAFNAESITRDRFVRTNDDLFAVKNRMNFRRDLASPMSEFLGVLVLAIILWFGGRLILLNEGFGLNGAGFLTYIGLFSQIINPLKSFSSAFYNMQKGTAALHRIEEILKAPNTVEEKPDGRLLDTFSHSVEFRNVDFYYGDVPILKDISFTLSKGKTIALVGSSGSGKSTLADLVPRFHDATKGEVLIDGVNIRDYSLHSVRSQISIVTQEAILFNDTIATNIALGKPDASMEEIVAAAKAANAYNFISQKEDGFHTNIGDRGNKLSGGEKQRVTIARALLKNPPLLILDEATSALDTESERLVQDAINTMMQERTSLVIAHRLSTVRHADEILVLDKGVIVERGTHEQLLEKQGRYFRLVQMQEVK